MKLFDHALASPSIEKLRSSPSSKVNVLESNFLFSSLSCYFPPQAGRSSPGCLNPPLGEFSATLQRVPQPNNDSSYSLLRCGILGARVAGALIKPPARLMAFDGTTWHGPDA
jgi:hypothetical protein